MTRRTLLGGVGGALGAAALGCHKSSATTPIEAGGPDAAPPASPDASVPVDLCKSDDSLSAAELLAPIEHIVVLCMENRSFDHYLGALKLIEGRDDIDGLTGDEWNPDPDGNAVGVHLLDNFTPADPPHSWDEAHRQWNDGANDGFVVEHAGAHQNDVMGYHVREQLPQMYALADASAICTRWFSSVMGPTWPNRFYLHGGTAGGRKSNVPYLEFGSVFDKLDAAGVSHKNYFHDVPWATGAYGKTEGLDIIERYFEDAANGSLPAFSLIDPQFFGAGANDDHPNHDIRLGQALIAATFSALAQSPLWEKSLFVVTYDEHGGFYDHVAPPTTTDQRSAFQQLGFRVPSIVAGPHVKQGCAVDTTFEHTSVIRTLMTRFGIDGMGDRVAAAADLSSCIDAERLSNPAPPPSLPAIAMSRAQIHARPPAPDEHPEISAIFDELGLPATIDRRFDSQGITDRFLDAASALGVVELSD